MRNLIPVHLGIMDIILKVLLDQLILVFHCQVSFKFLSLLFFLLLLLYICTILDFLIFFLLLFLIIKLFLCLGPGNYGNSSSKAASTRSTGYLPFKEKASPHALLSLFSINSASYSQINSNIFLLPYHLPTAKFNSAHAWFCPRLCHIERSQMHYSSSPSQLAYPSKKIINY